MSQITVHQSPSIPRRALFGLPLLLQGQTRTAGELFDGNKVQEIRLELEPASWQTLRDTFRENTWYRAAIHWNGINANCTIRSRGNGSRNETKPGLKVSFTRFADSGPFLGLETFVLTNFYQDPTMLRNFLAQRLFTRAGLPAPRFSFARLTINGEYWGVYGVGEEIEDQFLVRHFGEKSGYLYEYSWVDAYGFENRGDEATSYTPAPFEPKNNSKSPDPQPLVDMIVGLSRSSNDAFLEHVERYLNPEQYLTMLAIESYCDDRDGQTGTWGMNGFFLYRFAKTTQFWMIPWDKDHSFFEADRSPFYRVDTNVLASRLLAIPKLDRFYRDELRRIAGLAGGAGGWLEAQVQSRINELRPSYRADTKKPYPNGLQDEKLNSLIEFVQRRHTHVLRYL